MAGKAKPATRRPGAKKPAAGPVGIVVRRGALRRFDAFTRKTADLPVIVSWDRRQHERRVSSQAAETDRRQTDRRRKPPYTWEVGDFVLLDAAPDDSLTAAPREIASKPNRPATKARSLKPVARKRR